MSYWLFIPFYKLSVSGHTCKTVDSSLLEES